NLYRTLIFPFKKPIESPPIFKKKIKHLTDFISLVLVVKNQYLICLLWADLLTVEELFFPVQRGTQ
ncbi:hypothetical protein, partial [Photobacterium damselae]|uniref:hypothetical protein n=1 Tax=Photobacterium damselae TaxID=38293 RepID=UPI001B7FCA31